MDMIFVYITTALIIGRLVVSMVKSEYEITFWCLVGIMWILHDVNSLHILLTSITGL